MRERMKRKPPKARSEASVDLGSPESAPPVVISSGISRAVQRARVCVSSERLQQKDRMGASTLSPEN